MKSPCQKQTPLDRHHVFEYQVLNLQAYPPRDSRYPTWTTCVHWLKFLEGLRWSSTPVEHGACCTLPFRPLWLRKIVRSLRPTNLLGPNNNYMSLLHGSHTFGQRGSFDIVERCCLQSLASDLRLYLHPRPRGTSAVTKFTEHIWC